MYKHIGEKSMKKNDIYQVEIIDQGFEGEGIAKIEDITVFIEGALTGEIVDIVIVKILSNFAYGKLLKIVKKSKNRQDVDCKTYQRCGGCSLRHMIYSSTLCLKTDIVKNCLYKSLHRQIDVKKCIGMEAPFNYRNKLIYPVGINKDGKYIIGVYAKRSHDIVQTSRCYIQNEKNEKIARDVFNFLVKYKIQPYDEKDRSGIVRHIMIRNGHKTGEVMVIIVVKKANLLKEKELVKELIKLNPEITTIVENVNEKDTNVILGSTNIVLYGRGYIYDGLGEYTFKISPFSFYQVNSIQTELLYNTAIEEAKLSKNENIFDLYCGIGTIGIFASKQVKKVFGIEIVEQAIEDAKENAKLNNIGNCEFTVGLVEQLLPELVKKHKVDTVFLDPPRKGCDKKALKTLLEIKPKKIVYISCNPATLARDIAILEEKYILKKVQPIDMFPWTSHVETVSVLTLKK